MSNLAPQGKKYHVNGPSLISVGPGGFPVAGALSALGITQEGADVTIRFYDRPIPIDTGGVNLPGDLQEMGKDAVINLSLPVYDEGVLEFYYRQCQLENGGNEPEIGKLVGLNGGSTRLVIQSSMDIPWRFFHTRVRGDMSTKLGTRNTVWNLSIYAWALIGVQDSALGTPLYDNTAG